MTAADSLSRCEWLNLCLPQGLAASTAATGGRFIQNELLPLHKPARTPTAVVDHAILEPIWKEAHKTPLLPEHHHIVVDSKKSGQNEQEQWQRCDIAQTPALCEQCAKGWLESVISRLILLVRLQT